MTKLSPSAQAIVDAGRAAQSPGAATKAGVLHGLERALMEPPAAGASALAQASGKAGVGKILIGSALVVALGVGYFLLRGDGDNASRAPQHELAALPVADTLSATPAAATPAAATPAAATVSEEEELEEAPALIEEPASEHGDVSAKTKAKAKAKVHHKPRISAADSLLAEQKLIGAAQRATRDGDYATAKALLAQHRREFARGVLAPERKAAIAITSCLGGDLDKGQRDAARFLESHAKSPLANQVRKSCQLP